MVVFRTFLVLVVVSIAVYTALVGATHGWNLFPIFFGDILAMTWPGQFNLDFLFMLLLSGLWLAWRHDYSPAGLGFGLLGVLGGAPFLSVYLLIASLQAKGDTAVLLLGERRASSGGA